VATGREKLPFAAHRGVVYSVAVTPDGKQVISSGGTTVRFWDVASMRQVRKLEVRQEGPAPLVLMPDGKSIATVGYDNAVRFWDLTNGKQLPSELKHEEEVNELAVSPGGELLLSSTCQYPDPETRTFSRVWRLNCWRLATGQTTASYEFNGLFGTAFSPNGDKLLVSSGDATLVWAWPTAKELLRVEGPAFAATGSFSPDGRLVATSRANEESKTFVGCWDIAKASPLWEAEQQDTAGPIVFSPDGKVIASADLQGAVHLWSAEGGKKLATLRGHDEFARCLVFSPDGRRLLSGGQDTTMLLWDVESVRKEKPDTPE
jgi:WD40 repeat protein